MKEVHIKNNKIVYLGQSRPPTHYYNILADLPAPMDPPLHPGTKQPIGPQDHSAIFQVELNKQEVSAQRFIEIPDEVRNLYRISRATPFFIAANLENAIGTHAKIYFNMTAPIRPEVIKQIRHTHRRIIINRLKLKSR